MTEHQTKEDFHWLHWPSLEDNGAEYTEREIVEHASMYRYSGPGIYFLLFLDEIVYVGQSVDVGRRLEEHWNGLVKDFNRYFVIRCEKEDLNRLEAYYILRFRPKHNISIPKCGEL